MSFKIDEQVFNIQYGSGKVKNMKMTEGLSYEVEFKNQIVFVNESDLFDSYQSFCERNSESYHT